MGAHNLSDRAVGKTMREAYDSAVSYAEGQHGHDPYNGTISTTEGFNDHTPKLEKLINKHGEKEGLRMWYDEAWDNTSKWEEVWGAKHPEKKEKENLYIFAGWAAE